MKGNYMKQHTANYLTHLENLEYLSAQSFLADEFAKQSIDLEVFHSGLAICYSRTNRIIEARQEVSHIALGLIAEQEGDFALTEEEYKKAVSLGSNEAYSWFMYGTFLLSQGRYDESLKKLLQAQALNNTFWANMVNLAHLYFRLGKYIPASRYAISAFFLKPSGLTLQIVAQTLSKTLFWFFLISTVAEFLALRIYSDSVVPLVLLGSTVVLVSLMNYLSFRKKIHLLLSLLMILGCIAYYYVYIS
jgi:tetratricopeptide (TPR) repeat protein